MSEPNWSNTSQDYWKKLAVAKSQKSEQDTLIWATTIDYIEDSFDWKCIYQALAKGSSPAPTASAQEWVVPKGEKNTTILENGHTFENSGTSEICFSEAVSKNKFSSGVHSCAIRIVKAKEYGGDCSNTNVGLKSGKHEISVHGDGSITVDENDIKTDVTDLKFGEGALVNLTFDCDKKTITFQVEGKASHTENWPTNFKAEVQIYGKVIRKGDKLKFEGSSSPAASGIVWTFVSKDNNTEVINNGNAFRNKGSDICWSKGKSSQEFSSGVHTAVIKIDKAKEYGGHCSNTYVGIMDSNNKTCYISGDGRIHAGGSLSDINAKFSEGNKVKVTVDCSARSITWQVESKPVVTANWPTDFSSAVGIFGQVIRNGDSLSFDNSAASSSTSSAIPTATTGPVYTFVSKDNNTEVINNGNAFRNKGSDICWSKGKSSQEFSSGVHTAVIKIDKAKEYGGHCSNTYVGIMDSNNKTCYISGDGNVHSKSSVRDINAEFSEGDKVKVTIDCNARAITWQVGSKPVVTTNWPTDFSSAVGFFGQVIRNGDSLSFDNSAAAPSLPAPTTSTAQSGNYTFIIDDDDNTEIINNGNAFRNKGSDICWSKGKSSQEFSSGVHTAVIKIDKAKEYGGHCSNTYVGIISGSGSGTCYISGDGNVNTGSSTSDKNAEFSEGNKVKVTIDCSSRTITWQVESKPVVTATWPTSLGSSVRFFGQVIRNGDSLSFDNSAVAPPSPAPSSSGASWTFVSKDNNTEVINNGNAFRNKGSDICWSKGKSSQEFSSGVHTAVIKIDKAKEYGGHCSNTYVGIMDSNNKTCYISGDGNVNTGSSTSDKNAEFSEGNKVKVTVDCSARTITWQVESKPVVTANWPTDFSSAVGFFGQVIRHGDSLSFDNSGSASTLTGTASSSSGAPWSQMKGFFGSNSSSSCIVRPRIAWNSDPKYCSPSLSVSEGGFCVSNTTSTWSCAAIPLPAAGRFAFKLQISSTGTFNASSAIFGLASDAKFNSSQLPGSDSLGVNTNQTNESIGFKSNGWSKDEKVYIQVDCDNKFVTFYDSQSNSWSKASHSFSFINGSPVLVVALQKDCSVRLC